MPKLPQVKVYIHHLTPKPIDWFKGFCETVWIPRFIFKYEKEVPKIPYIIHYIYEILELNETNELIEAFDDLFIKEYTDFTRLIELLISNIVIAYFEDKLVYESLKEEHDLDYLSNIILSYLLMLAVKYFNHTRPDIQAWVIKSIQKKAIKEKPEVLQDKDFLQDIAFGNYLSEKAKTISETIRKLEKEVQKFEYFRAFALHGTCLEDDNFRLFENRYYLKKFDFVYLRHLDIVEYANPIILIKMGREKGKEDFWERSFTSFIASWESENRPKDFFPLKPDSILEFRGKVYLWELLDVDLNLYKIVNLLNLYKLSAVRVAGFIVYPRFLNQVLLNLRMSLGFLFDHIASHIPSIIDPHKLQLLTKDASVLREFITKNIQRLPLYNIKEDKSYLRTAIERYNKAIFTIRYLDRSLGLISLENISEATFLAISGMEAIYRTNEEKKNRESIKLGERVSKLLSSIAEFDQEKVRKDIIEAYTNIRSGYAHASNIPRSQYWDESLSLLIRLLDYLRVSIIFFLQIDEKQKIEILNALINRKFLDKKRYKDTVMMIAKLRENEIDKKIIDVKKEFIRFLSQASPYQAIQYWKKLIEEAKKTKEK